MSETPLLLKIFFIALSAVSGTMLIYILFEYLREFGTEFEKCLGCECDSWLGVNSLTKGGQKSCARVP